MWPASSQATRVGRETPSCVAAWPVVSSRQLPGLGRRQRRRGQRGSCRSSRLRPPRRTAPHQGSASRNGEQACSMEAFASAGQDARNPVQQGRPPEDMARRPRRAHGSDRWSRTRHRGVGRAPGRRWHRFGRRALERAVNENDLKCRIRTQKPCYEPKLVLVVRGGIEPPTPRFSGTQFDAN